MLSILKVVIPGLQTQPDIDVGALRQEVVKEQLLKSALPKSQDSQPPNGSVTELVVNPQSSST